MRKKVMFGGERYWLHRGLLMRANDCGTEGRLREYKTVWAEIAGEEVVSIEAGEAVGFAADISEGWPEPEVAEAPGMKLVITIPLDGNDLEAKDFERLKREAETALGMNVEVGSQLSEDEPDIIRMCSISAEHFTVVIQGEN